MLTIPDTQTPSTRRRRIWTGVALAIGLGLGATAVALSYEPGATAAPPGRSYSGAVADLSSGDSAGEWHSQARDNANSRFSPLKQIDRHHIGRLRVAWTFSDGSLYGHEGAPLADELVDRDARILGNLRVAFSSKFGSTITLYLFTVEDDRPRFSQNY